MRFARWDRALMQSLPPQFYLSALALARGVAAWRGQDGLGQSEVIQRGARALGLRRREGWATSSTSRALIPALPVFRRPAAFTVVEVMMASLILMVGFIGLIEAVIITSTTMDHARRQMLANQIINHEIEEMYLSNWSTISGLTTTTTTIAIDRMFWPVWLPGNSYTIDRGVSYQGNYYRCIAANTGKALTDTSYWSAVTTSRTSDIVFSQGATFTLTRNVIDVDPVTNIREINFVVTWVVTSSRLASGGTRLTTTHTCANSAWYGKNGLQLSYRKS